MSDHASTIAESIPSILEKIIQRKREEIASNQQKIPAALLEQMIAGAADMPRGFYQALQSRASAGEVAVIAEIKKASPSKGVIREDFDPQWLAENYENAGAACLSVLTDVDFFQGDAAYLEAARTVTKIPVLRKDFIIDEYQVLESRAMGADCILLIAACLDRETMHRLTVLAYDLGMDVLVEIHNKAELEKVRGLPIRMLGINNRDLHTFQVNLSTTFDLAMLAPKEMLIVTESGIQTADDVRLLSGAGINAFLIGETFMREQDPGEKLRELIS